MSYLKDTNIEAYNQINIELSELTIEELEQLPNNIIQVVYWQCNHNSSHIWAAPICERGNIETDQGCPFCKNEMLYSNGPKLILSRRIYSRVRDNIEHRFHCFECKHTWSIVGKEGLTYHDTCTYCAIDLKIPPFKEKYKKFLDEWDSQGNLLNFDQIDYEYNYEIIWRCKKCNQLWESTPLDRLHNVKRCPYCSGRIPIPDQTSFAALYPDLLKEYIGWKERNPYEIFPNSNCYSKWKCPTCHLPYMANLKDKIDGRILCPNCSSTHPISTNLYDHIISEYDHKSNYINVPIDELLATSKSELCWICSECNNIWTASLFSRLYENKECPYCNGRKVIPGKTSFKAIHPELMKEWDNLSNLLLVDPDMILDTYNKIVWWNCTDCGCKYPMSPARKVMFEKRKQISCLRCKGIRRRKSHII